MSQLAILSSHHQPSRSTPRSFRRWPRWAITAVIALFSSLLVSVVPSPGAATASTTGYGALSPSRVLDTREGVGASVGRVGAGGRVDVRVTGVGGVPADGVAAVVLNVTAINPSSRTFLTVWPSGESKPGTSNLNARAGVTVPNLVIARVGAGGQVSIGNQFGSVDVAADVMGWIPGTPSTPPGAGLSGSLYYSKIVGLDRLDFDTRTAVTVTNENPDTDFAVSKDGTEYVYGEERGGTLDVHVHSVQSLQRLTTFDFGDTLEAGSVVYPSPDNRLYAGLINGPDVFGPSTLRIMGRDGADSVDRPNTKSVAWGPDGSLVAVTLTSGFWSLVVFPLDGNSSYVATTFSQDFDDLPTDITVSPDNSLIAYSHLGNLWTVPNEASATPRRVAESTVDLDEATFSPDGRFLAFSRADSAFGCGGIHVIPARPATPVVVTGSDDEPTKIILQPTNRISSCGHGMFWLP
ncbi:MAG: hypothetical protein AB8G14_16380 [Ilumatobacter sp.]